LPGAPPKAQGSCFCARCWPDNDDAKDNNNNNDDDNGNDDVDFLRDDNKMELPLPGRLVIDIAVASVPAAETTTKTMMMTMATMMWIFRVSTTRWSCRFLDVLSLTLLGLLRVIVGANAESTMCAVVKFLMLT
jgi:hypothetical protein